MIGHARLEDVLKVSSLRAQEAVYHRRCLKLFSLQRDRPTRGRESDEGVPPKRNVT